jgi:uncharacterized coiled-coil protein SlyX
LKKYSTYLLVSGRSTLSRLILLALLTLSSALLAHTTSVAQDRVPQRTAPPADAAPVPAGSVPAKSSPSSEEEIDKLKAVVADQQKRIEQLEHVVDDQRKLIEQALHVSAAAPRNENPTTTNEPPKEEPAKVVASAPPAPAEPIRNPQTADESPLTIRIGNVSITPYGFLDLTAFVRQKNVGSGIATNFAGIPFSNTVNGNLSEFRFTGQGTRLGARFDARYKELDFLGMVETDFVGFSPTNVAVTTNSSSMRIRLAWLDVRKNKWEVLGGQSWSLLTPNRKGTSPIPADVFSTQDLDHSTNVGLTWGRTPQFRVIYHANRTVTFAVSLEAAEQYGGGSAGAGEITLPAALVSSYTPQINLGTSTFATPNLHPDVIAKVAFDPKVNGRDLHLELAGLLRSFRFFDTRVQERHQVTGGGILAGVNYEAFKNFRLIANGFYSNGGGRYIFGVAPDVIINADGRPSLVHSTSTVSGFEYQLNPNNLIDAYYGGVYVNRSAAIDANGNFIGYGYPGSPLSHNRSLQQFTLGYTRTFWRDPNYGALQFITQYSYLVRHPWSVPPGQPTGADNNFVYLSFRYVLPGAPPPPPKSNH